MIVPDSKPGPTAFRFLRPGFGDPKEVNAVYPPAFPRR